MYRTFFVLLVCSVALSVGYYEKKELHCGMNEEVRCIHTCPPQRSCITRRAQYKCAKPDKPCEDTCVCKDGYFRNYLGTCITNEQCDLCKGPNEFFACDSACDNVCETLSTQNRTNCPIKNIVCNKKCYCKDGFARDRDGICVPQEKCDSCIGVNEEYVACKRTCPPEHCISLVAKFKCVADPPCIPGCACKRGFLREDDNKPCRPTCECSEIRNTPDCKKSKSYY